MGETAVIVNELGEVGIDHHLLRRVDERTVLLASGCVCCTLRGDLADELRDLLGRRDAGEIPPLPARRRRDDRARRPGADRLHAALRAASSSTTSSSTRVVTTVDAQHGLRGAESLKQAAAADTLVVTKTDLRRRPRTSSGELGALNPTRRSSRSRFGDVEPDAPLRRAAARATRASSQLADEAGDASHGDVGRCASSSTSRSTGRRSASG